MKRKSNQKESFLIAVWTLMMTMAIPTLFIFMWRRQGKGRH